MQKITRVEVQKCLSCSSMEDRIVPMQICCLDYEWKKYNGLCKIVVVLTKYLQLSLKAFQKHNDLFMCKIVLAGESSSFSKIP